MDADVIRSYLIGIGFSVDQAQYKKFEGALTASGNLVKQTTGGILLDYLKWQIGITGVFTTVAGTIVSMADKAAMAEQDFRLMGMRMFMTTEQAKKTKIALDALGQPLEAIAWDPELHARFTQLIHDQERLQAMLGPDYAKQMKAVRDMRFEFTRMEVVLEYLGMKFLGDVFKGLGLGDGNVMERLQQATEWLMENGPRLAQELATTAVPVLRETWVIVKDLAAVLKLAAVAFVNLIGIVSGDTSLQGMEVNFLKVGRAIEHVVGWLSYFLEKMVDAEKLTIHLMTAAELAKEGKGKEARAELAAALSGLNGGSGAIVGSLAGSFIGGVGGAIAGGEAGPLGILAGGAAGSVGGAIAGGAAGALGGYLNPYAAPRGGRPTSGAPAALTGGGDAYERFARAYGLDPALLRAVAQAESGGKQYDANGRLIRSSKGAMGIMQLMPGTARMMGLDATDPSQNIEGGARQLRALLDHYGGNIPAALAGYNWGQGHVDRALRNHSGVPAETRAYIASVRSHYNRSRSMAGGQGAGGSQIIVGDIHINQPNATPREIQRAVVGAIEEKQGRQIQRNLADLGGAYAN